MSPCNTVTLALNGSCGMTARVTVSGTAKLTNVGKSASIVSTESASKVGLLTRPEATRAPRADFSSGRLLLPVDDLELFNRAVDLGVFHPNCS
jgi:hypothetical protein